MEFSVGASVVAICAYCRATVLRGDRGLQDLGRVAAVANVPSLVAIGDSGTLAGRPFQVLGRVQLDHGAGPWDEWHVTLDHGATSGWLAWAEGEWLLTTEVVPPPPVPAFESLRLEQDVAVASAGELRVVERREGQVTSAEGELPEVIPPGARRRYVDLRGGGDAFATIDYGDGSGAPSVFAGRRVAERELVVTQAGERAATRVAIASIKCPSCGGELDLAAAGRTARLGCRYCGAVSDVAEARVVAAQELARASPAVPLGARGTLGGRSVVCIAEVARSTLVDGERYGWEELLLFSEQGGFQWLVRDEAAWLLVEPMNPADLDLRGLPGSVRRGGHRFSLRNEGTARVDRVLGEVYWRCEVGESVATRDYVAGREVLSREEGPGEVRWSQGRPIPWDVIARGFGLPEDRRAAAGAVLPLGMIVAAAVVVVCVIALAVALSDDDDDGTASGVPRIGGGSSFYVGGK